jgi:hypothetical protein
MIHTWNKLPLVGKIAIAGTSSAFAGHIAIKKAQSRRDQVAFEGEMIWLKDRKKKNPDMLGRVISWGRSKDAHGRKTIVIELSDGEIYALAFDVAQVRLGDGNSYGTSTDVTCSWKTKRFKKKVNGSEEPVRKEAKQDRKRLRQLRNDEYAVRVANRDQLPELETKEMKKTRKKAEKEAKKSRKEAEKATDKANKAARKADKDATKTAAKQTKEAEKRAKKAAKKAGEKIAPVVAAAKRVADTPADLEAMATEMLEEGKRQAIAAGFPEEAVNQFFDGAADLYGAAPAEMLQALEASMSAEAPATKAEVELPAPPTPPAAIKGKHTAAKKKAFSAATRKYEAALAAYNAEHGIDADAADEKAAS